MKTAQLLNYAFDRWTAGEGNLAELTVLYGSENEKRISAEMKGQKINFDNLSYSKIDSVK